MSSSNASVSNASVLSTNLAEKGDHATVLDSFGTGFHFAGVGDAWGEGSRNPSVFTCSHYSCSSFGGRGSRSADSRGTASSSGDRGRTLQRRRFCAACFAGYHRSLARICRRHFVLPRYQSAKTSPLDRFVARFTRIWTQLGPLLAGCDLHPGDRTTLPFQSRRVHHVDGVPLESGTWVGFHRFRDADRLGEC